MSTPVDAHASDQEFIEHATLATIALDLAPEPMRMHLNIVRRPRPSLFARALAWLVGIFRRVAP